ncbi:hypothetical protein H1R20_g8662, partial [Candolleomyces eurysporus]
MSFATLQTVEELLPFAANVERKALPEVIGFLNHCLSVAPQWTAKDTDLVRARQLLLGSTMAIAARGAIDTAKGLCPRIEAWVNILAKHDNWISDPNAPLDLAVFKQEEPPPHLPNKALEPRGQMETETAGDVDSLEQRKQEGKGKGQSTASGDEPMNLDLPEHEELGGKKRRTPIVSDDEMEPLEEVATKRQKTDLKTFQRIGGAPGLERDQEEGSSGEATKLAKDELTHEAIKKLQQDFEALDSRFQNLDIRPFINESQRSVQGQVTAMGKKYAQELKKVEDSASQMLRRVELLEEQAKVGSKAGSTLTQEQVEQMINLKLAGVMEGVSQGGSGVDGEMVQAIIDQKIGWFTAKALEELVRQKVDTAVQGGDDRADGAC